MLYCRPVGAAAERTTAARFFDRDVHGGSMASGVAPAVSVVWTDMHSAAGAASKVKSRT
jgi:hypothetical protein